MSKDYVGHAEGSPKISFVDYTSPTYEYAFS